MNNAISISLFRVSGDSKTLDMIFECPEGFFFDRLLLEVRHLEGNQMKSEQLDLSEAIFIDEDGLLIDDQTRWTLSLPLLDLGIDYPAMYIGHLHAVNSEDETIELEEQLVCSDVNNAYKCILKDILNNCDKSKCVTLSDESIRNYLILYGHQASMTVKDFDTAELYFKLISNCFSNCDHNKDVCGCNHKSIRPQLNNCNCGK